MGCWISNPEKPDYETILCFDLFDNNQMADLYPVALLFMTDILLFFVFHISMRQSHPNNSLFYRIDFVVPCNLFPCTDLFDCNSCIAFYKRHIVVKGLLYNDGFC